MNIMSILAPGTSFYRGVAMSVMTRSGSSTTGSDAFIRAIRTALDTVDPSTLHPVAPSEAGPAFQPKALLASIVYCYVRQIYGSADIEGMMAGSTDTRALSLTTWPDAHMIREFRRNNRKAIQLCLMTALWLLGLEKVKNGTVTKVNDKCFAEEATRRIIMAMFTDSMELGEA
jgi:transposase